VGLPEFDDQSPLTKMKMKKRMTNGTEGNSMKFSAKIAEVDT
jgi:hypothetical protein